MLGDLYGHLCAAAKPQPTSLYSTLHIEGQKSRERAKQAQGTPRRRADLGDLLKLGNVELRRVRANRTEKRTKTGMEKVIDFALYERGLHPVINRLQAQVGTSHPLGLKLGGKKYFEGTRNVPEYGRPVPSGAANVLIKATKEAAEKAQARKLEVGRNA